jgi:hypothetical protein
MEMVTPRLRRNFVLFAVLATLAAALVTTSVSVPGSGRDLGTSVARLVGR